MEAFIIILVILAIVAVFIYAVKKSQDREETRKLQYYILQEQQEKEQQQAEIQKRNQRLQEEQRLREKREQEKRMQQEKERTQQGQEKLMQQGLDQTMQKLQGTSLQAKDGYGCLCPDCKEPLVGFGRYGGYCNTCMGWRYDKNNYKEKNTLYGAAADSLVILAAYDNVYYQCAGEDGTGILYVTPGALLINGGNGSNYRIPYSEIDSVFATTGLDQQMVIQEYERSGRTFSHQVYLNGMTYDGADGSDFKRICQLIQEYKAESGR